MDRQIDFWDLEDTEYLHYEDRDEAIENVLDGFERSELTGELEICGYTYKEVTLNANKILNNILENLEECYGGEDPISQPEAKMLELTEKYASEMIKLYRPWACDLVVKETIDIREWVLKNCPEWLED
jgi:hypothetical protein